MRVNPDAVSGALVTESCLDEPKLYLSVKEQTHKHTETVQFGSRVTVTHVTVMSTL